MTDDDTPVETGDDASPKGGFKESVALLGGGVAALATGLTSLTATGNLGRVQRNHPGWFSVAVGLVLVAGVCWLLAARHEAARAKPVAGAAVTNTNVPLYRRGWRWLAPKLTGLGILLTGTGVILAFVLSIVTVGEPERPNVTVTLDPATMKLTGTAKVSHLSSDEPLTVAVDGMVFEGTTLVIKQRLAESSVGPDGDGDASHAIAVDVPPGHFDAVGVRATTKDQKDGDPPERCGSYPARDKGDAPAATTVSTPGAYAPPVNSSQTKTGTGCQYLMLPTSTRRPGLAARWTSAKRDALDVTVVTPNATNRGKRPMALHVDVVVAFGKNGKNHLTVGRFVRDPAAPGEKIEPFRVAVPRNARVVCAIARLDSRALLQTSRCPLRGVSSMAVQLRGPGWPPVAEHKAKKGKKEV